MKLNGPGRYTYQKGRIHKITFKDVQIWQKLKEEIKAGGKKQIRSSEPIQTIQNYGRGV